MLFKGDRGVMDSRPKIDAKVEICWLKYHYPQKISIVSPEKAKITKCYQKPVRSLKMIVQIPRLPYLDTLHCNERMK